MGKPYWRESADGWIQDCEQVYQQEKWVGWRLILAWSVVIGGSWAIAVGILVWVLQ